MDLQSIKSVPFNRKWLIIMFMAMSVQLVAIEGMQISFIKVGLLAASLLVFFRVPYMSKAVWACVVYWLACFLTAILHDHVRFSTLGYLGLFLAGYITFYNLVHVGTITFVQFKKLLRFLLLAYVLVLCVQQVFVLVGIHTFPLFNLHGSTLNKLPSLACEPSHTARIITAAMLGYVRCLEIERGEKIPLSVLFEKENRLVTIGFLWMILTMGSGTGMIATAILALYFVRLRTAVYVLPVFVALFFLLQYSGNKQFERALAAIEATLTGDYQKIQQTDSSASTRIVPLLNTLKVDLDKKESWIGEGNKEYKKNSWADLTMKTPVIEQYGLIGLLASLFLLYLCAIHRFFSLETIYFVLIALLTIANGYVTWSMMYVFTLVKYFQEQKEKGQLF